MTSLQPTAPTRLIDPVVLARIGDLELVARVVVEGVINGLHRSPHLGSSMDFAEHRPYMPGDDIRRIDWKLWAAGSSRYTEPHRRSSYLHHSAVILAGCSIC